MDLNHSPNVEMPSPGELGEEKVPGGVMSRVESLRTAYARGVKEYASIFVDPKNFNDLEELFEAVKEFAKRWLRLSESTIEHRMRYARFMANHPVFPINFRNLNYDQFLAHMRFREEVEKANHDALKHEVKTIKMFLKAYGMDDRLWFYKLPPKAKTTKRIIPLPQIVYKLINSKYSADPYENALYQYLFAHSFWIGWRVPSEIVNMKVSDVDIENGCIYITETKKHKSIRQIYPDKVIMDGKTRKSFKNWIDHWRPKVENQYSGDALYLQPSGKPFTVRHLGHKLSEHGKKVWQHYQPYTSRHWNAIAMLIRTKLETGAFEVYTVKNWLGHEKITTTESYIRYAQQFYRLAPYDWIKATLKSRFKPGEKGSQDSFYETRHDKNGFDQNLSLRREWARRNLYNSTGEKSIKTSQIFDGFGSPLAYLLNLFFLYSRCSNNYFFLATSPWIATAGHIYSASHPPTFFYLSNHQSSNLTPVELTVKVQNRPSKFKLLNQNLNFAG